MYDHQYWTINYLPKHVTECLILLLVAHLNVLSFLASVNLITTFYLAPWSEFWFYLLCEDFHDALKCIHMLLWLPISSF